MQKIILIILTSISIAANAQTLPSTNDYFIVTPYLQIGAESNDTSLELLWHTKDTVSKWTVEFQQNENTSWIKSPKVFFNKINISNTAAFVVYNALITPVAAGNDFNYRVKLNGNIIFKSFAKAPKSFSQPYKFVVFGDIGAGSKSAKKIANEVYKANADMVAVTGDIVYEQDTIADYRKVFWPIYNAQKVDSIGVPLMSSIPFVAAVGNHDADSRDLNKLPDALAYYYFWSQPLNGPIAKEGSPLVPILNGSEENKNAFYTAAGKHYPSMTNFSFNYGNAHWTMLDADVYVDWNDSTLKQWVIKDLENSQNMTWHFVAYHHPGFSSSIDHFEQQQMRLLAPIFEKGKVDIVFNGHVHNYQRSFPLHFKPQNKGVLLVGGKENKNIRGRVVNGLWTLDKQFDGKENTKANGVIYIVTGAGGKDLYGVEQNNNPDSWQKFTNKFISNTHSFTEVLVNGNILQLKQIDANGNTIDNINLSK